MPVSILISGSGPGQWGDQLRDALILDLPRFFPEATEVGLASASLDGWAVEMALPDGTDGAAFVGRLRRYLEAEPDPWDVNIVVTRT